MSNEQELNTQSINDPEFAEIKIFSPSSRINRLRYWAHSTLMTIPFYLALALGLFLAIKVSVVFWVVVAAAVIGMMVFGFILIIQRLHDLDKSGWFSLLILVPLANFFLIILLIFFKGTSGANKYGLPTPPNKTWHWILGLGGPLFFIILSILATLALPTYQNFVLGAQQEQIQDYETLDNSEGDVIEDEAPADEATSGEKESLEENLKDDEGIEDEVSDDATEDVPTIETTDAPAPDAIK